eukprot:2207618-Rhodomonas_salina.1
MGAVKAAVLTRVGGLAVHLGRVHVGRVSGRTIYPGSASGYAMSGPGIAYGQRYAALFSIVLRRCYAVSGTMLHFSLSSDAAAVQRPAMLLGGTDLDYGATRRAAPSTSSRYCTSVSCCAMWCCAMCGTDLGYAAMRYVCEIGTECAYRRMRHWY